MSNYRMEKSENKLEEKISERLFNQSCVYSGDYTGNDWNKDFVQNSVYASNCRFHAKQFLDALKFLGYEAKQIDVN